MFRLFATLSALTFVGREVSAAHCDGVYLSQGQFAPADVCTANEDGTSQMATCSSDRTTATWSLFPNTDCQGSSTDYAIDSTEIGGTANCGTGETCGYFKIISFAFEDNATYTSGDIDCTTFEPQTDEVFSEYTMILDECMDGDVANLITCNPEQTGVQFVVFESMADCVARDNVLGMSDVGDGVLACGVDEDGNPDRDAIVTFENCGEYVFDQSDMFSTTSDTDIEYTITPPDCDGVLVPFDGSRYFPAGFCTVEASEGDDGIELYSSMIECLEDGSDANLLEYDNLDCSGTAASSVSVTAAYGFPVTCGTGNTCPIARIREFYEDASTFDADNDCATYEPQTGESYEEYPIVLGVCMYTGENFILPSCDADGTGLQYQVFATLEDCEAGTNSVVTVSYEDECGLEDGEVNKEALVEVDCEGSSTATTTEEPIVSTTEEPTTEEPIDSGDNAVSVCVYVAALISMVFGLQM